MQASVMRIDEFISNKRTLVIPVYQRNYDWRKIDCEQLFWDLEVIAKNGKDHFIGTFVYEHKPAAGIFQEFVIIDGQQRITSIILIQARAKKLAAAAIKIWMLPEEYDSSLVKVGDTLTLDSDFSLLKGTKPAVISISNKEKKINNWIDLLREVMWQLYEQNEDIFRQAARGENLPRNGKLFSTEPQILNKPLRIDENYYMDSLFSTQECLRTVKVFVENFDRLGETNVKDEIYFTLKHG